MILIILMATAITTFLRHFLIEQRRPGIHKNHHNADDDPFHKRCHFHSLVGQTRNDHHARQDYNCILRRSALSIAIFDNHVRKAKQTRKAGAHLLVTLILSILIWLVRLLLLLLLLLLGSLGW